MLTRMHDRKVAKQKREAKEQAQARVDRLERACKAIDFTAPKELSNEAKISLLEQYLKNLERIRSEGEAAYSELISPHALSFVWIQAEIDNVVKDILDLKMGIARPDLHPELNRRDNR
jgi:hypothetical protein